MDFALAVRDRVFPQAKLPNDVFEVQHYFGTVRYETVGFIETNRNRLGKEISSVLESASTYVALFSKGQPTKGFQLLTVAFEASLTALETLIKHSNVSFIRCVKPNSKQLAFSFDHSPVEQQLRALGVVDTLRVKDYGYPFQLPNDGFVLA